MLKHRRDIQCLVYMVVIPVLTIYQWRAPHFIPWAYLLSLLFAPGISCVNHNHAHYPFWRSSLLNRITDTWIGLLQGYPTFVVKPSHIGSHHRYNQGPEDVTRLSQFGVHNNLFGYLAFPVVAAHKLGGLRRQVLSKLRVNNPRAFRLVLMDYTALAALYVVALAIDWRKTLIFILVPHVFGLHCFLASNYLQHAHAKIGSKYDHARNFVGWGMNHFLFNIGLHSAHHETESMHWSEVRKAHNRIVNDIDPRLIERSIVLYFIRVYILGLVVPRWRSAPLN
jgi:fatty acid desaturase